MAPKFWSTGPKIARLSFRRHRLRRLHRKLNGCRWQGGISLRQSTSFDDNGYARQVPPRLDYAVQVTGPLLPAIHHAVHQLWALVRWVKLPAPGVATANTGRAGGRRAM